MSTQVDLDSQVQGILPRFYGGTGSQFGFAQEMLLVGMVNDFGSSTLTIGGLVRRSAASGILQTNTAAGQQIMGVVAGRFSPTTGDFEAVGPAPGETVAVCVYGRCIVLTESSAARWEYLRASATAGHAEPNATAEEGTFGLVLYNIDASHCQALIGLGGIGGGTSGSTDHGTLTGLGDDDHTSYVTVIGGGGETVSTVVATGATETIDLADGNVHDLTLDDDCVLTLTGATGGVACSATILLRQDGTGGWTVTWPGSVVWPGGVTPTFDTTAGVVEVVSLFTLDGGSVWFAFHANAGGAPSPATTVTDETTWGITPAVGTDLEYARQDHTHGSPTEPTGSGGHLLISDTHSTPLVFDDILQNDDGDDFLYSDT